MESHYQSRNMTVTNTATCSSDLFFVYALAQQSSWSIVVFKKNKEILIINNRLRTFDNANEYDTKCLSTLCDYLAEYYNNIDCLKKKINCTFIDFCKREFFMTQKNGKKVYAKILPVFSGVGLNGVILMAKYYGWII